MFRHRARPDLPPLDEETASRLLRGAPADDVPDAYRRVAALFSVASPPPRASDFDGAAAAIATFLAAHQAANRPVPRARPVAALALASALLATFAGTTAAATVGALPQPVQAVAHDTLGVAGISVPGITPDRRDRTAVHDEPNVVAPVTRPQGGDADPDPAFDLAAFADGIVGIAAAHVETQLP